jgi:hypothetical protein
VGRKIAWWTFGAGFLVEAIARGLAVRQHFSIVTGKPRLVLGILGNLGFLTGLRVIGGPLGRAYARGGS